MSVREGLRFGAFVLVSFGCAAALAQGQAPTLQVSGTGSTYWCGWNNFYGCTGPTTTFPLDAAHPSAPSAGTFTVGGAFGSPSTVITIQGNVSFGPNPGQWGGATNGWSAGATLDVLVVGSPGTAYDLDIIRSASVTAATSAPYDTLTASSDLGSVQTQKSSSPSRTFDSINTIHGTTSGQITTQVSVSVGMQLQTGCPNYDIEGCLSFNDPGSNSAQVTYTLNIVARIAGTGNTIRKSSGDGQTGNTNQPLPQPLVVEVRDSNGSLAEGVPVVFQVTGPPSAQGQTLSTLSAMTVSGLASTQLVLGDQPGEYQVTASCACTSSVNFTARTPISISLRDPVPALLANPLPSSGPRVVSDTTALAALAPQGRPVQGVAADGVAELLIQINGAAPNEQLSATVDADGSLAAPGGSFQQGSVSLIADAQGNAFAVYQAPADFVRQTAAIVDSTVPSRIVNVHVASLDDPAFTADATVTIVRPVVMLIHGLWSNYNATWANFTPLVNDSRFQIEIGEYGKSIGGQIVWSDPSYAFPVFPTQAALGLEFNAPGLFGTLQDALDRFRQGVNKGLVPVAAIQADIVAHSMGGLMARRLASYGFLDNNTLGAGIIHKLVTIDTPHLGTPLASALQDDTNTCVRNVLAGIGNVTYRKVQLFTDMYWGAVADLAGDGKPGGALSNALQNLQGSAHAPIPTAMIAGVVGFTNLDGLSTSLITATLRRICNTNPLAAKLTKATWALLFTADGISGDNDGVVGKTSQLNGVQAIQGLLFDESVNGQGYIHSSGVAGLGFNPPTVLDGAADPSCAEPTSSVACRVIGLLDTAVTSSVFQQLRN